MRILGKIISVLYLIVFVAVLFSLSALICASNLLKGDFYTEVLESVELEEISAKDLGLYVKRSNLKNKDKSLICSESKILICLLLLFQILI